MLLFVRDKKRLAQHFRKDRVLFAYHLGDLDDFYFPDCIWPAVCTKRSALSDALLLYTGGELPTLLAFGLTEAFDDLVRQFMPLAPDRFYAHYIGDCNKILAEQFSEKPLGNHLKMRLDPEAFDAGVLLRHQSELRLKRLDLSDQTALEEFYSQAYPANYFVPRMLQTRKYFGFFDGNDVVAAAGVHVASDEYRVAVLGNIATRSDYRGRGLATQLTSHLVTELTSEGKQVCLNVQADNRPAIACYEKLGFVEERRYQEGFFDRLPSADFLARE